MSAGVARCYDTDAVRRRVDYEVHDLLMIFL